MRRIIGLLMLALGLMLPVAAAQAANDSAPAYGEPGYGRYGQGGNPADGNYYGRPQRPAPGYYPPRPPAPGYYPQPGYVPPRPPGYGYGNGGYGYGGGYYRPPRPAYARVCVTSRGNCMSRPGPVNAPCSCYIPNFGTKRGALAY